MAAAVVTLAVVAAVGLLVPRSSAATGGSPASAFTGKQWRLTSLRHAGRVITVPADQDAVIAFTKPPRCHGTYQPLNACSGEVSVSDTLNDGSGSFLVTPTGFEAYDVALSAVGWAGDPASDRGLTIAAMDAVIDGDVRASVDQGVRTLSRGGYVLTFRRGSGATVHTDVPGPTTSAATR